MSCMYYVLCADADIALYRNTCTLVHMQVEGRCTEEERPVEREECNTAPCPAWNFGGWTEVRQKQKGRHCQVRTCTGVQKFVRINIFFSVLVQQKVWWRGLQPAGQMSGPPGPEPARSSGESFAVGITINRSDAASTWTKICLINR